MNNIQTLYYCISTVTKSLVSKQSAWWSRDILIDCLYPNILTKYVYSIQFIIGYPNPGLWLRKVSWQSPLEVRKLLG